VLQALITAQKWLLAQQFLQGIAAVRQINGDSPTAALATTAEAVSVIVIVPLQVTLVQAAVQVQ
jgi:hypothetical protein